MRACTTALSEFSGNVVAKRSQAFDDLAASPRRLERVAEFEISRISK